MRALVFAAAGLLALQAVPADAKTISGFVVFGDSNVDGGSADPGSLFDLTGGALNGPPNVGGRNANGPIVVEYAADRLGLPLRNYAVSGATTGQTNLITALAPGLVDAFPAVENTGALAQIDHYAADLAGTRADPLALHVYWAGSNDIFGATASDLDARIAGARANIEAGVARLDALGARHVVVATRTARPDLTSTNNQNGIALNAEIRKLVTDLDPRLAADVTLFDAYALSEAMKLDPDTFGFTVPSALCVENAACLASAAIADLHVQWDGAHLTTRAHQVFADALTADLTPVPAPAAALLMGTAMVVLGAQRLRRRR